MTDLILISGCSGGGKSTLLTELARRGNRVIQEPGRRIVSAALQGAPEPLPWSAPIEFARRALDLGFSDQKSAASIDGPVFFDCSVIDAAVGWSTVRAFPRGKRWDLPGTIAIRSSCHRHGRKSSARTPDAETVSTRLRRNTKGAERRSRLSATRSRPSRNRTSSTVPTSFCHSLPEVRQRPPALPPAPCDPARH